MFGFGLGGRGVRSSFFRSGLFTSGVIAAALLGGCVHNCCAAPAYGGSRDSGGTFSLGLHLGGGEPRGHVGATHEVGHGVCDDECLPTYEFKGSAWIRDSCGRRRCVSISGTVRAASYSAARGEAREKLHDRVACSYPGARIRNISLSVWRTSVSDKGYGW